tara:strand:+ start:2637 stop:3026 length:390 start_codon:yes stop_codon:yes gene_type:complete
MSNKKETIEQIVDLLRSLVDDDEPQEAPKKTTRKKRTTSKKTKTNRKKSTTTTKKASLNKFESMDVRGMHKEDVEIDRKLNVKPPAPRTRKYNSVDVTCRSCGKREKVNPVLVTEASRYKCNACSRLGG